MNPLTVLKQLGLVPVVEIPRADLALPLAQALTDERAVWCPADFDASAVHLKLDRQENLVRMRRKLTVNYEFDPHLEAAERNLGLKSSTAKDGADGSAASAGTGPKLQKLARRVRALASAGTASLSDADAAASAEADHDFDTPDTAGDLSITGFNTGTSGPAAASRTCSAGSGRVRRGRRPS